MDKATMATDTTLKPAAEPPAGAPKPQSQPQSQPQPQPQLNGNPPPIVRKPVSKPVSLHRSPKPSLDLSRANVDVKAKLNTSDDIPSAETLRKVGKHVLLNKDGKSCSFRSLYTGPNVARRVLVIFVRHFFCGNCQEFLRSLSEAITPDALLRLPVSTFIAVVGCGDPKLIDEYLSVTKLQFPVYTDPTGSLFNALGMMKTLSNGEKPAYFQKSMGKSVFESVVQTIKHIPDGYALKSGDLRQVGGEFLFEPHDIMTPTWSPRGQAGNTQDNFGPLTKVREDDEEKKVTWCHRMKTTRDHSEIPELMDILGLERPKEGSVPGSDIRKGNGVTMADDIRKLSADRASSSSPNPPPAPLK